MSADGKIADERGAPARFPSRVDRARLEGHLSRADAALFGAGTLRAYGTGLSVRDPALLRWRERRGLPPQPVQIVCSASGALDPDWRFFRQPFPRWLLTGPAGARQWRAGEEFERVAILSSWRETLAEFARLGIRDLAVLGGGELIASLLDEAAIDEIYLTVCPVLLGGKDAPTPVGGALGNGHRRLGLIGVESAGGEIFLHYRVER